MSSLRILMVAPQPFLRPRGTPFSVLHRLRALVHQGHTVDLVTYPFGDDVEMEGLRIVRTARPPGVRDVVIGPSLAKIFLDVPLFARAWRMAHRDRYDLVHTHEEAGVLGGWIRRRLGVPHLYDMHSSLPLQFRSFGRFDLRPVVATFERAERFMLAHSDGVIAICDALGERAREVGYRGPLQVIENTMDLPAPPVSEEALAELRRSLGLGAGPVVAYTGTLEEYQGLDLLLDAARLVHPERPDVRFLIVGGTREESEALGSAASRRDIGDIVRAVPAVPPSQVRAYQRLADILVTTRTRGVNTPLKIYQYLRSDRPIVATDIPSHTQVLDGSCAELVAPDPEGVARGLLALLADPARGQDLAVGAARLAEERYSDAAYHARLREIVGAVGQGRPTALASGA
jgi:glycosyltransferase involved in cell wall biosynthesis